MRILIFITMAVVFAYPAKGQTCNCESNFEWLKTTFEENDAGFQYIIDKKGQSAYNIHNQLMLEKVMTTKTLTECTALLNEWLKFFRSGHIGIESLINEPITSKNLSQPANSAEYEKLNVEIPKFEEYINEKKEVDFEGIWQTGNYKIGIKKEGMNYIGFIIESDVDGWREPGLVKLKIEQDGGILKTTYYMRDHSSVICSEPEWLSNNYIRVNQQILKRLKPTFEDDPLMDNYLKAISSQVPYIEKLNSTTLYLRIPSFDQNQKRAIDSVILTNKDIILKTENLIIDIHNGGGGSDASYREILPLLYTNPIRTVRVEFLSTTQNNKRLLDFANNPEYQEFFDEKARQRFKEDYEKLQGRLGEFVNLSSDVVGITKYDTIYDFPKNIGIIINERNGSTDEQFLLAAKQSKKVKLFGTTTFGALDISNMYFVDSPRKEFRLHYCLTRSLRIPGMIIDDIGIQPDYYLDKTISHYKWVEFVNNILNQ